MLPEPDAATRATLAARLARFERQPLAVAGYTSAAVALVLSPDDDGGLTFLLTRRPLSLARHGGQFALPGGKAEAGETAYDAAARELEEELGVARQAVSALGLLDDFATRSGFVITPVVMWAEQRLALAPDPREVAVAYRIPLRSLYAHGGPRVLASSDGGQPLLSFNLLGTHIHSPTAAILYQLRSVAFDDAPVRVAHYEQPAFAWK